jgi:hypothetical protein
LYRMESAVTAGDVRDMRTPDIRNVNSGRYLRRTDVV